VVVRMLHEGRLVGSLNGFVTDRREWTPDDLVFLKGIADEAALAIANASLYRAQQQQEQARAQLLHQVISAQEDERLRIARELHDETGQSITALILGLDVAREIVAEGVEKTRAHLWDIQGIAETMLQDIRRIIADLRPLVLDELGLGPAIVWYGRQRLTPLGIELCLSGDGLRERLPRPLETALFRIAQEAMTNVARYSHASVVNVNSVRQDGHLTLEIADNGCGFDPQALCSDHLDGKGLGLRGMQERVSILGGELLIHSAPGKGTRVSVRVPVLNGKV
jgi:signal transduction histidine kinase